MSQILLVDDDAGVLKLYGLILEREGFEVLKAESAAEALDILDAAIPDLFILDIMMPEMDGFELCAHLRARPQNANVPVMFLSARRDAESVERGFDVGADTFLFKPVLPRDLVAKTHSLLSPELSIPVSPPEIRG